MICHVVCVLSDFENGTREVFLYSLKFVECLDGCSDFVDIIVKG